MKGAQSRKSLRKITSMCIFLVATLLGCLIIPSYSSLKTYQKISASGIVRAGIGKTVIWSDGSKETIRVTEQGRIFLNGSEVIAFGFNIYRYGDWGDWDDATADKALDRLVQDGVRFMELSIPYWFYDSRTLISNLISFWMSKLYNHKMFVFLCMHNPDGTHTASPENAEKQMTRINITLELISSNQNWANMIFAFGYSWEQDYFGAHTAEELEAYLSNLYPRVKSALRESPIGDVPVIAKLSSPWGRGPEHLYSKPIIKWSNIPSIDIYYRMKDYDLDYDWIANEIARLQAIMSDVGKTGINVWYSEFGLRRAETSDNSLFTKEILEYGLSEAGYNDLSLMMIWELWDRAGLRNAFDVNGDPLPWYERIAPYFPTLE